MARARGYAPRDVTDASVAIVQAIRARARAAGKGHVAVFDLDGCLFDTRPRQVQIFRELAAQRALDGLYRVEVDHFRDWSISNTLRNAGLDDAFVAARVDEVRTWWQAHFFTSRYVGFDHAMPGAVSLVREVHEAGLFVVYLTGRDESMRAGTEEALRRFGFPYDRERTSLLVKPDARTDDTAFKESALAVIAELGDVVLYMDNEPSNVNLFHRAHPEALVVFVETDHSDKADEPNPELPWLRSFLDHPV